MPNPIEWLEWIYGKWFVGHPWRGYLTVSIACCIALSVTILALWLRALDNYAQKQAAFPKQQTVTASNSASQSVTVQQGTSSQGMQGATSTQPAQDPHARGTPSRNTTPDTPTATPKKRSPAAGSTASPPAIQGSNNVSGNTVTGNQNVLGNGNIVGSTLNIVPLNPADPYASNSKDEVAGWALSEADKVEKLSKQCVDDLIALKEDRPTSSNVKSTPQNVKWWFGDDIRTEIPLVQKLHDSMLAKLPSLKDGNQEAYLTFELTHTKTCWHFNWNGDITSPSVPSYLRQMAHGLLDYKRPQSNPTYSVTNPTDSIVNQNSPNYGEQTVIHNPPINPNNLAVTWSCDGVKHSTGSGMGNATTGKEYGAFKQMVATNNEAFREQDATAQFAKYKELLSLCSQWIDTSPDWLSPFLFCSQANLVMGNLDEARSMLSRYDAKAGDGYDDERCKTLSDHLHNAVTAYR